MKKIVKIVLKQKHENSTFSRFDNKQRVILTNSNPELLKEIYYLHEGIGIAHLFETIEFETEKINENIENNEIENTDVLTTPTVKYQRKNK